MTTHDNRALWELVENWRSDDYIGTSKRAREFLEIGRRHADELAAILERPVVVGIPDEPRNDRDALLYLMRSFETESWQCPQCGQDEECSTMDSAYFLRDYLRDHPIDHPIQITGEDARKVADEYFRLCKQDDEMPMAHGMWTERLRLSIESMVRGKS